MLTSDASPLAACLARHRAGLRNFCAVYVARVPDAPRRGAQATAVSARGRGGASTYMPQAPSSPTHPPPGPINGTCGVS